MKLTINLSDEELQLAQDYSTSNNTTIEKAFKQVFFDKIQNKNGNADWGIDEDWE